MAVPDYQTLMLPVLRAVSDGAEHSLAEIRRTVAEVMQLSGEDRNEMLASGRQRTFDSRANWAVVYLKQAALLESTGRAKYRITPRGLEVLKRPPDKITVSYLQQYPEFVEFQNRTRGSTPNDQPKTAVKQEPAAQTPEEALEATYLAWRQGMVSELLEQVKRCSPAFFEQLVLDLLLAMGYGGSRQDAAEAVGRSGDEGIDGIIKEDRLGLDVIYVQAKRWEGTVGSPIVTAFAGSLLGKQARKGILITTSIFSSKAIEYVQHIEQRISLIDGEHLAQLMLDHGVGVSDVVSYTVKRIDTDYFGEGL